MISGFFRYQEYKDSGVKWLGDIPKHWTIGRLKHATESCVNGVWGNDPSDGDETSITCIRVADFDRNNLTVSLENQTQRSISKSDFESRSLQQGDLLLEKSGGGDRQLVGQVVSFDKDIPAVCSNFVARMRIRSDFSSRFIAYYHSLLYSLRINFRHIKQTTGIQNLDSSSYLGEWLLVPPLSEQARIAAFLDEKTAEIDDAIAKKQRLIELLQEQKAILINRAVTQGLDPNVSMRDSGVAWIGQVPAHWEVKRAKFLFNEIDERSETGTEELLSVSHMTGVTPRSEKNVNMFMAEDYTGSKLCRKDDLVFNIMWAWMGALGVSDRTGIVSSSYGVYRQKKAGIFNSWYLEHLLRSTEYVAEYNRRSTGLHSSRLRLYPDMFFDMELSVPSRQEQDRIEAITIERTALADQAIHAVEQEIDKLSEFRQILISDAVTGKIKV